MEDLKAQFKPLIHDAVTDEGVDIDAHERQDILKQPEQMDEGVLGNATKIFKPEAEMVDRCSRDVLQSASLLANQQTMGQGSENDQQEEKLEKVASDCLDFDNGSGTIGASSTQRYE